jgi:hypothetical protein
MADRSIEIRKMASGNLSLLIDEQSSWESFPRDAHAFIDRVGGTRLFQFETAVDRMWIVLVRRRPFWLAVDELGLSLDSMSRWCNPVVERLYADLQTVSG